MFWKPDAIDHHASFTHRSPLGVTPTLATFRRRECFLYIWKVTSLDESATPHEYVELLMFNLPSTLGRRQGSVTNFQSTFSRGLSTLSEYLTTSGQENPSLSCLVNSEINCNHISVLMDWADLIALTDNWNDLYRKGFIWLFHDFDFCVEWVGRDAINKAVTRVQKIGLGIT